jgi:hypothetical protein
VLENAYQAHLITRIKRELPGAFILKNDSGYLQGIPDLLVLLGPRWAVLEVKISATAPYQPNQEYYLELLGEMSFSATIYPENEEDVLHDLQRSLGARRPARVSQR